MIVMPAPLRVSGRHRASVAAALLIEMLMCLALRRRFNNIITALETALEARRQRIIISQSTVSTIKWAGLLLQALCALIAIAMVHSDNRITCRIALVLFATGIGLSILLIAAYSRPFTGEISVGPELLKQVVASRAPAARKRESTMRSAPAATLHFGGGLLSRGDRSRCEEAHLIHDA